MPSDSRYRVCACVTNNKYALPKGTVILVPNRKCRKIAGFILSIVASCKLGTYPPLLIKINITASIRATTLLSGGTLVEPLKDRGRGRHTTSVRGLLRSKVGTVKLKPRKVNKGCSIVKIRVRGATERPSAVKITIGIKY